MSHKIQILYVPVLRCCHHPEPNISYIYGWKNEDDKFIPGHGDKFHNAVEIWTLVKFGDDKDTKRDTAKSWLKQRYHVSDSFLEAFTDHFMILSLVLECPYIIGHKTYILFIHSTINAGIQKEFQVGIFSICETTI